VVYLPTTANAIAWAASTDSATPGTEGLPSLYSQPGSFRTAPGPFEFVVTSGMLDGGNINFCIASKNISTGNLYRSTTYPIRLRAINYGTVNLA
jgi:hypothetical protein